MKRDYSLDLMRIISMLCVVIIHFSNYYCRAFNKIDNLNYLGGVIFNSLARIAVPIFFMISGALLIGGNHESKKYWKRIFKFTWILIIWNLIYYVWNCFYLGTSTPPFQTIFTSMFEATKAHLWFMYAIIGLYIILPFVQSMVQNMDKEKENLFIKLWLFFSGGVHIFRALLRMININTNLVYNVPIIQGTYYLGYFILGYILYKRFTEHKPKINEYCFITYLSSSLITIITTYIISLSNSTYYESFLAYRSIFIMISSIAVFILILNNKELINKSNKLTKFISIVAPTSFGIYLFHIIPFNILLKNINILEINSFIGIPILGIVITIISFLVIYIIKKIPKADKFLGI